MQSLTHTLQGQSLNQAIHNVEETIKREPSNADLRAKFVQFLLLAGEWQRAKTQLLPWQTLVPQAHPTTRQIEEALLAEQQRQQVFLGELPPTFLTSSEAWMNDLYAALVADAKQDTTQATALRQQALDAAPTSSGKLTTEDGQVHEFSWIADADNRLGPICELHCNGVYYWVGFDHIEEIIFQAPKSVLDLVWSHALVKLHNGKEQVCQIPIRYPLVEGSDDALCLSQKTLWQPLDDTGFYAGQGQKQWTTEHDEYPLLTFRNLTLNQQL